MSELNEAILSHLTALRANKEKYDDEQLEVALGCLETAFKVEASSVAAPKHSLTAVYAAGVRALAEKDPKFVTFLASLNEKKFFEGTKEGSAEYDERMIKAVTKFNSSAKSVAADAEPSKEEKAKAMYEKFMAVPELAKLKTDPELAPVFQDIETNGPMSAMKYMGNPAIMAKLQPHMPLIMATMAATGPAAASKSASSSSSPSSSSSTAGSAEAKAEAEVLKGEGNTLLMEGKHKEAIAKYEAAIKVFPHEIYYANCAAAHLQIDQNAQAASCCKKGIALNPNYYKAHYRLGQAWVKLGKLKEAADAYTKALELEPTDAKLREMLEEVQAELNQVAEREAEPEDAQDPMAAMMAGLGGGGGMGGMDFNALLQNPMLQQMMQSMGGPGGGMPALPPGMDLNAMMNNPMMQQMMQGMMGGMGGGAGGGRGGRGGAKGGKKR